MERGKEQGRKLYSLDMENELSEEGKKREYERELSAELNLVKKMWDLKKVEYLGKMDYEQERED